MCASGTAWMFEYAKGSFEIQVYSIGLQLLSHFALTILLPLEVSHGRLQSLRMPFISRPLPLGDGGQ